MTEGQSQRQGQAGLTGSRTEYLTRARQAYRTTTTTPYGGTHSSAEAWRRRPGQTQSLSPGLRVSLALTFRLWQRRRASLEGPWSTQLTLIDVAPNHTPDPSLSTAGYSPNSRPDLGPLPKEKLPFAHGYFLFLICPSFRESISLQDWKMARVDQDPEAYVPQTQTITYSARSACTWKCIITIRNSHRYPSSSISFSALLFVASNMSSAYAVSLPRNR